MDISLESVPNLINIVTLDSHLTKFLVKQLKLKKRLDIFGYEIYQDRQQQFHLLQVGHGPILTAAGIGLMAEISSRQLHTQYLFLMSAEDKIKQPALVMLAKVNHQNDVFYPHIATWDYPVVTCMGNVFASAMYACFKASLQFVDLENLIGIQLSLSEELSRPNAFSVLMKQLQQQAIEQYRLLQTHPQLSILQQYYQMTFQQQQLTNTLLKQYENLYGQSVNLSDYTNAKSISVLHHQLRQAINEFSMMWS